MREEVPVPDKTPKPPAAVQYRPYDNTYSAHDRATRRVDPDVQRRKLKQLRSKRKQARRNKKGR
jgi:hypothetical protein